MSGPPFADGAVIARAADKVAAEIGDETVILDIVSGYYFQLNVTGARIWALLEEPIAFGAICEKLQAAFAVEPAECRAEIGEFLALMQGKGLIEIEPAD